MENQLSMYDVLERPKWPVQHKGLYLGNRLVFHCTPENGEHISSLNEFCQGEVITAHSSNLQSVFDIKLRLKERIRLKEPYRYLSNNCEHVVSRILAGEATSPKLKSIINATAIILAVWVIIRQK